MRKDFYYNNSGNLFLFFKNFVKKNLKYEKNIYTFYFSLFTFDFI